MRPPRSVYSSKRLGAEGHSTRRKGSCCSALPLPALETGGSGLLDATMRQGRTHSEMQSRPPSDGRRSHSRVLRGVTGRAFPVSLWLYATAPWLVLASAATSCPQDTPETASPQGEKANEADKVKPLSSGLRLDVDRHVERLLADKQKGGLPRF